MAKLFHRILTLQALRVGYKSSTLAKDNLKHKGFVGPLKSGILQMVTFNY